MYKLYSKGTIEVITGPMFSGKSDELIKRIKLLGFAKIDTLVIKPSIDDRWEKQKIVSRTGRTIATVSCQKAEDVFKSWEPRYKAIAIDEAQFFDEDLLDVILRLASKKVRVIVSALDLDFQGKPFGWIPNLLAVAEMIDKLTGVCMICGKAGTVSYRKGNSKEQVKIGDLAYEIRCRQCHAEGVANKSATKLDLE